MHAGVARLTRRYTEGCMAIVHAANIDGVRTSRWHLLTGGRSQLTLWLLLLTVAHLKRRVPWPRRTSRAACAATFTSRVATV